MSGQSFRDYQGGLQHSYESEVVHNVVTIPEEEYVDTQVDQSFTELSDQPGSVDLDNLPKQKHNWVDRGTVMSCEGGDHPNHHAYKQRR